MEKVYIPWICLKMPKNSLQKSEYRNSKLISIKVSSKKPKLNCIHIADGQNLPDSSMCDSWVVTKIQQNYKSTADVQEV